MVAVLHRDWYRELGQLVESAERRLVIAAPFISKDGAKFITTRLQTSLRESGRVEVLTDLSPSHVSDGSLHPEAVIELVQAASLTTLWHVPRLHAKVYIADSCNAIVTSGNLTNAAFYRNIEYGVRFDDESTISAIQSHFDDYRAAATTITLDDLLQYASVAEEVRVTSVRHAQSVDPRLKNALGAVLQEAEDRLIRLRLAGGAVHTVFEKTLHYLLAKYGALATTDLHEMIQALHPDLCDDSIDRVIDGKRFGKKWKHAVRTAQQQLKRKGIAEYESPNWRLVSR